MPMHLRFPHSLMASFAPAYPWQSPTRDPAAVRAYKDMLQELDTTDRGDLYGALMNREKDTLDVVNRIVGLKEAQLAEPQRASVAFYRKPVQEIAAGFVAFLDGAARRILTALAKRQKMLPVLKEVAGDNSAIFNVGLLLILVATLMFVLFI